MKGCFMLITMTKKITFFFISKEVTKKVCICKEKFMKGFKIISVYCNKIKLKLQKL